MHNFNETKSSSTSRKYILIRRIQYEGSSLLGLFDSQEEAIEHVNTLDGYLMDEFNAHEAYREDLSSSWLEGVHNAVGGISIDGPMDVSFEIYTMESKA